MALPPDTYLEPDLALLRPGDYRERLPRPEDVLLVVEVADASLDYDLTKKVPLYAKAGVPEVWVQDLLGESSSSSAPRRKTTTGSRSG